MEKAPLYAHPLTRGTRNIGTSVPMRGSAIASGRLSDAYLSRTSRDGIVRVEHMSPRKVAGSFV